MSRAFVKEDSDQPERLPDRPQSSLPNLMTAGGRDAMAAQLATLEQERSALLASADLAERSRLPVLERDIRYYRARLKSAQVMPPAVSPQSVVFGCEVSFVDDRDCDYRYRIVGEDEADIAAGKISWASPLARALLGKAVGDETTWARPAGDLDIEIVAISP